MVLGTKPAAGSLKRQRYNTFDVKKVDPVNPFPRAGFLNNAEYGPNTIVKSREQQSNQKLVPNWRKIRDPSGFMSRAMLEKNILRL